MVRLMVKWLLSLITFLAFCEGQAMEAPKYSVLHFNGRAITANGKIDFIRWEKMDFPWSFALNEFVGPKRRCFYRVADFYFEVSTQKKIDELAKRYRNEANARKHLSIKDGYIHFDGKRLKYPGPICEKNATWGIKAQDGPPQGFVFCNYLIFMIKARQETTEDPYDLVVYNLKDDSFAINRTHGSWPQVWLFKAGEAVPAPKVNQ